MHASRKCCVRRGSAYSCCHGWTRCSKVVFRLLQVNINVYIYIFDISCVCVHCLATTIIVIRSLYNFYVPLNRVASKSVSQSFAFNLQNIVIFVTGDKMSYWRHLFVVLVSQMWARVFLRPRLINRVHLTWSLRSFITMQLKTKELKSLFTEGLVSLAGKFT